MARTDLAIALVSAMLSIINYSLPAQASVHDKKDVATVSGAKPDVGATVTKDYFVVPIFYATNRSFAGDDGQIQYSEEPNGKGLLFGVKNIPAAAPNRSPIDTDTQNKMQWQKIQVSEKVTSEPTQQPASPSFDKSKCALKDKTLQSSEIVPAIKQYMEGTGNHEIVIFVHGCCATYDRSMQRAATVAAHMQVPVLLYDWVSPKGFKKYLENETRAEQTMDDFCRFLAKVEKLTDAGNVTIIGHSMGARFVDQALVRRGGNEGNSLPKFK